MSNCLTIEQLLCERDDRVLFEGVSLSITSGSVVHVLGENGAGKTTLLKTLAGLSDFYTGKLSYNGISLRSPEYYASSLFLGHESGVKPLLTPLENLRWYFGLHGQQKEGCVIDGDKWLLDALNAVNLLGFEYALCSELSAGQKRRVALARLYISCAPVWILDEPFTALDVEGVEKLEALISQHAENGGIVILTSHQPVHIANIQSLDLKQFEPQSLEALSE